MQSCDSSSNCGISEGSHRSIATGKFTWKKSVSTSNLISFFEPSSSKEDGQSISRSQSGTDLTRGEAAAFKEKDSRDGVTATVTLEKEETEKDDPAVTERREEIFLVTEETPEADRKAHTTNEQEEVSDHQEIITEKNVQQAAATTLHTNSKTKIKKISERIELLKDSQSSSPSLKSKSSSPATPTRPNKWADASKRYRTLQTVTEAADPESTNAGVCQISMYNVVKDLGSGVSVVKQKNLVRRRSQVFENTNK